MEKILEKSITNINHIAYLKNLPHNPSKILLLGEGNFSFSLALAKTLQEQQNNFNKQITIYSTSFDSQQDLLQKYPEFEMIQQKLQQISKKSQNLTIQLLHSIDATNINSSLKTQLNITQEKDLLQFDKIIFNHPHCGQDDLTKNSSLVAHFFYSALQNLKDQNSEIQFSLLEGQCERWKLPEIYPNLGLQLIHEEPLASYIYENGFEARRNLVGSNFQNSNVAKTFDKMAINSFNYVLCQNQEIKKLYEELKQIQEKEKILNEEKQKQIEEQKKKKEQDFEFHCQYCGKGFRKEQGKRTHEREEHEKKQNKKQQVHKCQFCDKQFKSEAGLKDHLQQKHQDTGEVLKPDFAGVKLEIHQKESLQKPENKGKICQICFQIFETEAQLQDHYKWLTPDLKAEQIIKCDHCNRIFKEKRALQQHLFTCKKP